MSKFVSWLKKTFVPTKETAAMWGLFGVSGLFALGGDLLRRHIDQQEYKNRMGEEIKKEAKKLVEGFKSNENN